jgi:hypothetical protein
LLTLACLFVSYYCFALCRISLDVTLPVILDDQTIGQRFNKDAA